ncbi:MAG: FAD-binding oxidoreductase [Solirubrobacteraceae bacterium]
MRERDSDVVVIGGGLSGTSVAYHLARAGKHVVLIERNTLASGASGASFGWVTTHFASYMPEYPSYHMRLMSAAVREYAEFAAEFGDAIEYEPTGGLSLIYDDDQLAAQSALVPKLNEAGIAARIIPRERVLELEPQLAGPFIGAVHNPDEALVNPFLVVRLFAREARRLGAQVLTHTAAVGIDVKDGAVTGVRTTDGVIRTHAVVNAAGLDAPSVAALVGVDVPVRSSRGQQLVVQGRPNLLRASIYGHGLVRPTRAGNYIVGGLREGESYDNAVTRVGIAYLAKQVASLVPGLRGASVTRAFSGLRPVPSDGKPIYGPAPGLTGFFCANLHFGVTLAPVTGRVLTDYVLGREPELDVTRYLLDRFQDAYVDA